MTAFQTYKIYLALVRHFSSDSYDYFRYGRAIKCSAESFEKRKDKTFFLRISRTRDPEKLMIGNFIFGEQTWIGSFDAEHLLTYEKFLQNGPYLFKEDLNQLKDNFNDNFTVDELNSIPYILQLYRHNKISLFTVCVFNQILRCHEKWLLFPQFIVFSNLSKKIDKCTPFFHIDSAKYRTMILNRFSV